MPYTDKDKVIKQLTDGAEDPEATAASLSDDVFDDSIENMCSIIDGYVGVRYDVPLFPVPEIIETIATDLVAYDVTMTFYQQAPLDNVDPVFIRRQHSLSMLKDIARGLFIIDVVDVDGNEVGTDINPLVLNPRLGSVPCGPFETRIIREVNPPW